MPTARVIEAVDVLKDGGFGLSTRFLSAPPDQLGLDGLEEGFDCGVIVAIPFPTHRHLEPVFAQYLLVVMRTVLAAPVCVMNAAFGWRSEGDGHFQGPDRQVTLHAIADCPTNDTPGMQIEDHRQIQPTHTGPDVADVASPFLVRLICFESRSSRFGAMLNV